jgi:parallel beta-helix repeat protein
MNKIMLLASLLFIISLSLVKEVRATDISDCTELNTTYGIYNLTADITNSANSTCMNITADNVTLDCQGHTIDGTDASSTNGIYAKLRTNITIKNCVVTDWFEGILFEVSSSSNLTNITSNSNYYGIEFYQSNSNTLSNATVKSNSFGITLNSAYSDKIKDSIIQDNIEYGIYLYSAGSAGANLIYNNLFNNTNNFDFVGTVYTNSWNTTNQTGTRIYSNGPKIGGNYWTNSTANGYSDTCTDANHDGFCDSYYELSSTGPNRDYLPLSDEYDVFSPSISDVSYSPSCIDVGRSIVWSWTQSDNYNISVSYCNFTDPFENIYQINSNNQNNIGSASCEKTVMSAGAWYVRIYVEDPIGNSANRLNYFEVKMAGSCAGGGGGGTSGELKQEVVYVPVCEEGFFYNATSQLCEPLPVEEVKPPAFLIQEWLLQPIVGPVSPFILLIAVLALVYYKGALKKKVSR